MGKGCPRSTIFALIFHKFFCCFFSAFWSYIHIFKTYFYIILDFVFPVLLLSRENPYTWDYLQWTYYLYSNFLISPINIRGIVVKLPFVFTYIYLYTLIYTHLYISWRFGLISPIIEIHYKTKGKKCLVLDDCRKTSSAKSANKPNHFWEGSFEYAFDYGSASIEWMMEYI